MNDRVNWTRHAERVVRAPRGGKLTCKGWLTEAALRMLMNNLDPDVAERPEDLVVYGGIGTSRAQLGVLRPHRRRRCERLETTRRCWSSRGKPVGVFKTHPDAPRVLLANSNLVPHWATWEHFDELERKGLMMYGQMTAGSWIYIGTQGIVQGTYETFVAAGATSISAAILAGRLVLTGGLGGMGGAQPLAATMAGAVLLARRVRRDAHRARACETRYLDAQADDLDEALASSCRRRQAAQAPCRWA